MGVCVFVLVPVCWWESLLACVDLIQTDMGNKAELSAIIHCSKTGQEGKGDSVRLCP